MNGLKKIIYNCRQATLLIEKKQLGRLTLRETLELRLHLFGCGFCRLYKRQSWMINRMLKQLFRPAPAAPETGNPEATLDADFKRDLQERIDERLR
jgi:hypothetical protein